jgi:hypothetical protein
MILSQRQFFAEENIIRLMGHSHSRWLRNFTYKVTAHTMKTEVLVFEADSMISILKTQLDTRSQNEIVRSYKLKLPSRRDRNPTFDELYHKAFTAVQPVSVGTRTHSSQYEEPKRSENLGLPSKSLRALLITGYEIDRRHELEEIVGDFPKMNDYKQLQLMSELK